MDRAINRTSGHVIVCGWGRVGSSSRQYLRGTGLTIVAVDRDPARLAGVDELNVLGDVTDDKVLAAAGIDRAYALITALDTDADNVFVTLSARGCALTWSSSPVLGMSRRWTSWYGQAQIGW